MRELIRRRLHGDQSGVTMVIVALCLVALIGMIVLVVDVGGLLWNRRAMVNASDAAALSAAKSCILPATMDPQTAEQAADALATQNSNAADTAPVNILQSQGCDTADTGYVTVQYGANQQLFFAGIFGASQGRVTTQATAIWGPAGSANPMPIVIYQNSFQSCHFDQLDPTKTCYVWEDNGNVGGAQSAFGLLDLRTDNPAAYGWNSNPGANCSAPGSSLVDQWIATYPDNSVGDLPLNYPNPTYVCRVGGLAQNVWNDLDKLVGQTLLFPINRCDTTLPGNPGGQLLPNSTQEATCPQTPGQYDIIGYFAATLVNDYRPNDPAVQGNTGTCSAPRAMPGPNNPFSLVTFGQSVTPTPCFTTPPDAVTNISITKQKNNDPGPQPQLNVDYTVDPTTPGGPFVQWIAPPSEGYQPGQIFNVSFNWSQGGQCGGAAVAAGNNSGHCLVLQPVEVKIGGSHPGGGTDSNVRAYKLCEPSIPGSCDPVNVPIP
jgi:Flp pilus assembly protein TadG